MRMTTSLVVLLTLATGCAKRPLTKQMEDEAIRAALRTQLEAAETLAVGDPWAPDDMPAPLENMIDESDEDMVEVTTLDTQVVEDLAIGVDETDGMVEMDQDWEQPQQVIRPNGLDGMAGLQNSLSTGGDSSGLQQSINNLTRAIDEQRMMDVMEARLADKQRLMDQMYMELTGKAPMGMAAAPAPAPAAAPATSSAMTAVVEKSAEEAPVQATLLRLNKHPEGYRVSGLGNDDAPVLKTGLQNGDIITDLDDKSATKYKTSDALQLIEEMADKPITMTRDETRVTLAFTPEEKKRRDKKANKSNGDVIGSLDELKKQLDADRKADQAADAREAEAMTTFISEEIKALNTRIDNLEDEQAEINEMKEKDRQRWNPFPKKAQTDPEDAGTVDNALVRETDRDERDAEQMARLQALMDARDKEADAKLAEQQRQADEALAAKLAELEASRQDDGSERDDKLEAEIASLKDQLAARSGREDQMAAELSALKDAQHAKELALTEKIARLEGSLTANQAAAKPDEGEADLLNSELAALRAELKSAQDDSASKQAMDGAAMESMKAEIAALKSSQSGNSSQVNNLFSEIDSLAAEREKLEAELVSADAKRRAELEEERRQADAKAAALQAELDSVKAAQNDFMAKYEADQNRLKERLEPLTNQGVTVREVDGNVQVDMASDVLFASGSATLSKAGRDSVRDVGAAIAPFDTLKVQIQGHTDNVPMKSGKYGSNWDLAFARSREVLNVLLDSGFPADRISAASFGDSRPVASNSTSGGRTKNRRIEIVLEIPVEEK